MKRNVPPGTVDRIAPYQFQPGQSGNPGGRPKSHKELTDAARDAAGDAMRVLTDVMTDPLAQASTRVSAAIAVLERAHGKPNANLNLNHRRNATEFTDDELDTLANVRLPEEGGVRSEEGAGAAPPGAQPLN